MKYYIVSITFIFHKLVACVLLMILLLSVANKVDLYVVHNCHSYTFVDNMLLGYYVYFA